MTDAAALFAAANAANQKLVRNLRTCEFISYTRREEDPFVVYADKLARFERQAKEAQAAWMAAASELSDTELLTIIQGAYKMSDAKVAEVQAILQAA
jgi:hypothetical protein